MRSQLLLALVALGASQNLNWNYLGATNSSLCVCFEHEWNDLFGSTLKEAIPAPCQTFLDAVYCHDPAVLWGSGFCDLYSSNQDITRDEEVFVAAAYHAAWAVHVEQIGTCSGIGWLGAFAGVTRCVRNVELSALLYTSPPA